MVTEFQSARLGPQFPTLPSKETSGRSALEPMPVNNSDRSVRMVSIISTFLAEVTVSVRMLEKLAALAA